MIDVTMIANAAVDCLAGNAAQQEIEIDTAALTGSQVRELIKAVFDAGEAAGVTIKGVLVDPMQIPLPADAEFLNAFRKNGRLIIVDINLDDKVIVRRARSRSPAA